LKAAFVFLVSLMLAKAITFIVVNILGSLAKGTDDEALFFLLPQASTLNCNAG